MSDAGHYWLIIKLARPVRLTVGQLGDVEFRPGVYVYTGSAAKGLGARVGRHLRKQKRLRWHIDYLTAHRGARAKAVILPKDDIDMSECELNQFVMRRADGAIPGFGSSDCKNGCGSHLAYFANQ